MNRHRTTGSGARVTQARWIKSDDRSWMRHDTAPKESSKPCVSLWFFGLLIAGLLAAMIYGASQIDAKHGAPEARETWSVGDE